jgi:hypothetical protein
VCEMPKSELKHQRELRFAWSDGTRWSMRLDAGVGWLKPSRWTEFGFRSDAKAQAETLRRMALNLQTRNKSGTVFYLFLSTFEEMIRLGHAEDRGTRLALVGSTRL